MRPFFALTSALCALCFGLSACSPTQVEYNSNSGTNYSLSTATTIALDTLNTAELNAPDGNNEDWYGFSVQENGFITLDFSADKPSDLIFDVSLMDSFSRPLDAVTTNDIEHVYTFEKREAEPGNYFISVVTNMEKKYGDDSSDGDHYRSGVSQYTVSVKFELPEPEPEFVPEPEPEPEEVDTKNAKKCVPADKCKSGQNCCKPKKTATPVAEEKILSGNIVSITPQGDKVIIKIAGFGTKKGVRKGATGKLHGSSIEAYIYSCAENACQATVEASGDDVKRYRTVDVVVK